VEGNTESDFSWVGYEDMTDIGHRKCQRTAGHFVEAFQSMSTMNYLGAVYQVGSKPMKGFNVDTLITNSPSDELKALARRGK